MKPPVVGGIADMAEPAAQLGASFLGLFGEVIFDPMNATVWLSSSPERGRRRSVGILRGDCLEPRADRLQEQLMRSRGDVLHRGRIRQQRARTAHNLRFGRDVEQVELAEDVHRGERMRTWERRARRSANPVFPSAAATAAAIRSG